MWILMAFVSACSAGFVSLLCKIGLKETDSNVATCLRTIVVFAFTFLMVLITNGLPHFQTLQVQDLLFLFLSGLSTGISWLCYYKALQIGDINKVVPVDKLSTVLTMILAVLLLSEAFTVVMLLSMVLLVVGTMLMIVKKEATPQTSKAWLVFAVLSLVFASLTTILAKVGLQNIDANVGTFIRTGVVLVMTFLILIVQKKIHLIKSIQRKNLVFILCSGICTGISWVAYFAAIKEGVVSIVVPIDKLSIVVTIVGSYFLCKEKLSKKALVGFIFIFVGTFLLLF